MSARNDCMAMASYTVCEWRTGIKACAWWKGERKKLIWRRLFMAGIHERNMDWAASHVHILQGQLEKSKKKQYHSDLCVHLIVMRGTEYV